MLGNGRTILSLSDPSIQNETTSPVSSFALYNREPLPDFASSLHSKLNIVPIQTNQVNISTEEENLTSIRSMDSSRHLHAKYMPHIEELLHMFDKTQFEEFSKLIVKKKRLDFAQFLDTFYELFPTKQVLEQFCKQHCQTKESLCKLLKQVFEQIDFFNHGTISWEQFYQTYANCKKMFPSWNSFQEPIINSWPQKLHFQTIWYSRELNRVFGFDQETLSLYSLYHNLQFVSEKPLLQFKSFVTNFMYCPTKHYFITGTIDKRITLYNSYKNCSIEHAYETESTPMSFALQEDLLFSGFENGSIQTFSLSQHLSSASHSLTGHTDYVLGLQIVPELNALFSCSMDKTIKLYDIFYWKVKSTKIGHTKGVHSIAYTNSKLLFSASSEREIYVWNTFYEKPIQKLSGHHDPIVSLNQPCSNTNLLYSTDSRGATIVWDIRKLQPLERLRATFLETHLCDKAIVLEDDSIVMSSAPQFVHWYKNSHYRSTVGKIQTLLYSSIFKMGMGAHGHYITLFHAHNLQPTQVLPITEGDVVDTIFCNEKEQNLLLCITNINQVIAVQYLQLQANSHKQEIISLTNQCKGEYRYIFAVPKLPYFLKKKQIHQGISLYFCVVTTRGYYFIFELHRRVVVYQSKITHAKSTQVMQQILFSNSVLVFLYDRKMIEIVPQFDSQNTLVLENFSLYPSWEQICLQDRWNCIFVLDRMGMIQCYSLTTAQLYCQFKVNMDLQLPVFFKWMDHEEEISSTAIWTGLTNGKLCQLKWETIELILKQQTQQKMDQYQITIEDEKWQFVTNEMSNQYQYCEAIHKESQTKVMMKQFEKRIIGEEEYLLYKTIIIPILSEIESYLIQYVDAFSVTNSNTTIEYAIVIEPFTATLQQLIQQGKVNSTLEMIEFAKWLAKALYLLHSKGITKGNLSSETVVQVNQSKWKLMDISCMTSSSHLPHQWLQKVDSKYVAPELKKEEITLPTKAQDMWCYGTILYEVCFKTILTSPITEQHLKKLEMNWSNRSSLKTPSSSRSGANSPHPTNTNTNFSISSSFTQSLFASAAKQAHQIDDRLRTVILHTLKQEDERWTSEQVVQYLYGDVKILEEEEQIDIISETLLSVHHFDTHAKLEDEKLASKMIKSVDWDLMIDAPSPSLYCMNQVSQQRALIGMAKSTSALQEAKMEELESSFIALDLKTGKLTSHL